MVGIGVESSETRHWGGVGFKVLYHMDTRHQVTNACGQQCHLGVGARDVTLIEYLLQHYIRWRGAGKLCIEVTLASKIVFISEELCIGCGICVKIINLPKDLDKDTTHLYGPNTFKLHRLPVPRPGQVLGLVGRIGIGKSSALKVLAGKLKPNLGRFNVIPEPNSFYS
nr:ABC transporter E family member 2 [Ipomoea batatas]